MVPHGWLARLVVAAAEPEDFLDQESTDRAVGEPEDPEEERAEREYQALRPIQVRFPAEAAVAFTLQPRPVGLAARECA